ncbi:Major facilitator [Parasponia andersonii]|uniref:Major facilitator n=1 Tax=Parasponia andersonii TaxID=3476 RepID=A0A2P5AX32_PARAD|nr:Major facilitator [Parasponia andersonii]
MGPTESGGTGANIKSLAVQVLTGRWLMVFATFLLMVASGASYVFSLYSNDIKSVLGYDQTTLNLIGFSKDLGNNIGILAGLINEVTPPWVVLSIGAVLNFVGNFMIWLAVARKIPAPKLWHMCLYIAVGGNSHTFTNTGAFITCVKNFPESRGVVMGLLTGYNSIGGAVNAQLYRAFYGDDTSFFTLFAAWLPTVLSIAFIRTIRIIENPNRPQNDAKVFYKFLYISLGLAGFLLLSIILERILINFTRTEYVLSAAAVLFLVFLPLVVVFKEEHKLLKSKLQNQFTAPLVVSPQPPSPPSKQTISWWKDAFNPPEIGEDFTILQALFSIEMASLLLAAICGLGGTITMIDNLGQIGTAFGYPLKKISDFVSLTSIWSYLGQITAGTLSEILVTKYKCPRPLLLTLIILFSSIGHVLIAFNVPSGLYVASVITGFCSGAFWPLIFTIISELFGLKHYSTLFHFGSVANPVALYLLNVRVTGYYYDEEAKKQMAASGAVWKPGEALNCLGGECFRLSFIIITIVALFGAVISLVLVVRTTKFYQGDIYKRFRNEAEMEEDELVLSLESVGVLAEN